MARPFGEASVIEENFAVSVDATNTYEKWKEWANSDILVKVKTSSTKPRGDGLLEIEPCTADSDVPIGVIRSLVGSPTNFPKLLTARVAVQAWRVNCEGSGTGDLADTGIGKKVKPDANGKATIVDTGGYGRVAGGTKANLVLSYDLRDNIR